MQNQIFQTLRFKLSILLAFFAIVPLIVSSMLFLNKMETTIMSEQKNSVNKQLTLVNDNVNSIFNSMLNNVSYFAEGSLLKTADASITSYVNNSSTIKMTPGQNGPVEQAIFKGFAEFGKTHPDYQYVYMGTEDGGYIQYPDSNLDSAFDPCVRPWYLKAIDTQGGAVLGDPYYFATDDVVIVGASQAIIGNDGRKIGVMAMDMSLDSLTKLFEKATKGSKGYYMLVTGDGTILADPSNPKNNFKKLSEVYGKTFSEAVDGDANFEKIVLKDKNYFIKSMNSDKTDWHYISVISQEELFQSVNQVRNGMYLILAMVLLAVILAGVFVSNRIVKPIKAVTKSVQEVADGNFDVKVDVKASGEIGQLVVSFQRIGVTLNVYKKYIEEISFTLNQIAEGNIAFELQSDYMGEFSSIKVGLLNISETLTDTLTRIKGASDQIASSSEQVSAGAQALAQGTTEQASSIEELSATVGEIFEQVKQSSQKAERAKQFSVESTTAILRGQDQMIQMVGSMDEIRKSSYEIEKIIKNIDDIAFQTNILALNAAVEAARAGAAGKGFAVVADEVRNLASKSAESAKNTSALIESALSAVEKGSKIVSETAKSLEEIVAGNRSTTEIVQDIANTSISQADSIEQVNIGVEQIAAVVQTNSATAEESAAASQELSEQARMMKRLIGKFQLQDEIENFYGQTQMIEDKTELKAMEDYINPTSFSEKY